MSSARSGLLSEASALSWKIARYGPPPLMLPTMFIGAAAYEGEPTSDRIPGTPGQSASRTAL